MLTFQTNMSLLRSEIHFLFIGYKHVAPLEQSRSSNYKQSKFHAKAQR